MGQWKLDRTKYTPQALKALDFAVACAARDGAKNVGTDHLLLALAHSSGATAALLRGVPHEQGYTCRSGSSPSAIATGRPAPPYSQTMTEVLDGAVSLSRQYGRDRSGTSALVVSLLDHQNAKARGLLKQHGIDSTEVRRAASDMLACGEEG